MDILCSIFCGICSLIGARFAVKSGEAPPLLLGIMTGIFMSLLILLIGVGAFQQTAIEGNGLRILLAALVGGAIAGISKPNKKKKRKKSRKK
jgi:putative membrane protein (TIGR04086 family)